MEDLAEIGTVSQLLLHAYLPVLLRSADCATWSECVKSVEREKERMSTTL